ncbi:MAG TPA: glycosyl hydrolase [Verrucomicrobiota bacterium]|nr:glycosyl hydrolase [Verrucomicrobiota bacterium]
MNMFFRIFAPLLGICLFCSGKDFEPIGSGGYALIAPEKANLPQSKIYKTNTLKRRVPTNKWWSSLLWDKYSNNMYPHPLAVRATESGIRIYYPGANITAGKNIINGGMPAGGSDFIVGLKEVSLFPGAKVDDFGDWSVTALFENEDKQLRTTLASGSPFVFFTTQNGTPEFVFGNPPKIWFGDENSSVLGISVGNRYYGLFAPSGSKWNGFGSSKLSFVSNGKNYFSVAALPDTNRNTIELFKKYAHSHIIDTTVIWNYDRAKSMVQTRFSYQTKLYEGNVSGTLFALYPHQWLNTKDKLTDKTYNSVRGIMKLGEGNEFTTSIVYPGVLPLLPVVNSIDTNLLNSFLESELKQTTRTTADTYWLGKQLGKLTTLAQIADQTKNNRDAFAVRIKKSLENFFTPTNHEGGIKHAKEGLFYYEPNWGTLIGNPASYGSDDQLNDHHFHYGYFIRAAAELSRIDPQWGKNEKWGGMVKMLIRDIANPDRTDEMFPFLRNFDVYAGHSWASGNARFADGNNNESSSEAVNAWYGIILFGEINGDYKLRDLGIWLMSTEIEAINHYWFDVTGKFHHPNYGASVVTMVWGGKSVNETWFSNNPEMVHGINFLPITPASLYLGRYPEYCEKNYNALVNEKKEFSQKRGKTIENQTDSSLWDSWTDIIIMYRALSNPEDGMKQFKERMNNLKPEAGNSLAAMYVWLCLLNEYGTVYCPITADTPLYAVFKKDNRITHIGYNCSQQTTKIRFSDNAEITIPPRSFGITQTNK